ncbi:MAG TPA: hypothetical protein VF190_14905 [Rhodothermales bacterium]
MLTTVHRAAPAELVARGVGYALNPLIFPPLAAAGVLAHVGAPQLEVLRVTAWFAVLFALVPAAHLLWLLQRRRIESLEVAERSARYEPLAAMVALHLLALMVVPHAGPSVRTLVAILIGCQLVNAAVVALITLRWKVSIHAAAAAGFVAVILFFATSTIPPLGEDSAEGILQPGHALLMLPVLGIVMWARVRVRVHTVREVVAGCALGLVLPLIELGMLQQMGLLRP